MQIPAYASAVITRLEAAGFEAYAVGGCVRDSLLGREPNDWDITTSAPPETTLEIFREPPFKAIPTGIAHGTVTVITSDEPIEVTTFRTDGSYSDHRRPDSVSFTSRVEDDLARRDFTVNAIAYSRKSGIIDPYGGKFDLDAHMIRAVGDPRKRFSEDALRILRAVRFASTLEFEIEPKTAEAAEELAELLERISRERVRIELSKLLRGKKAPEILQTHRKILTIILPSLRKNAHETVKLIHSLCKNPSEALLLAAVIGEAEDLERLRLDNKTKARAEALIKSEVEPMESIIDARKLAAKLTIAGAKESVILAIAKKKTTNEFMQKLTEIEARNDCLTKEALALRGSELKALGIPPQEIGKTQQLLLNAVIADPTKNEKDKLKALIKQSNQSST